MSEKVSRRPAFIVAMEYETGEQVPIVEYQSDADAGAIEQVLSLGYRDFSHFGGPIETLAQAPIARLFKSHPDIASEIDAVLVARNSSSFNILSFFRAAGMRDVPVLELGGMDCADLCCCLAYASTLVSCGIYSNVLCCFAVKVGRQESRVFRGGASFLGDGATCCVVSSANGPIELRDFEQSSSFEIYENGPSPNYAMAYSEFCKGMFDKLMARRSGRPFDHLVPINFPLTNELFAAQIGPACGALFKPNIEELAHISSADVLINLNELYASGGRGDVLIFGIGPWAACMIDAVAH